MPLTLRCEFMNCKGVVRARWPAIARADDIRDYDCYSALDTTASPSVQYLNGRAALGRQSSSGLDGSKAHCELMCALSRASATACFLLFKLRSHFRPCLQFIYWRRSETLSATAQCALGGRRRDAEVDERRLRAASSPSFSFFAQ